MGAKGAHLMRVYFRYVGGDSRLVGTNEGFTHNLAGSNRNRSRPRRPHIREKGRDLIAHPLRDFAFALSHGNRGTRRVSRIVATLPKVTLVPIAATRESLILDIAEPSGPLRAVNVMRHV